MATRTFPPEIDVTGVKEMWPQLSAFVATLKPGDVMQAPDDAKLRCDKPLEFPHVDVKCFWNGATLKQTTTRPYGAVRTDGAVLPGGKRFTVGQQLPPACQWGYISGPGIVPGTHVYLDANRKGGTLDRLAKVVGSGLRFQFTSKLDRSRCAVRISGVDFEHHDLFTYGPVPNPVFRPYELEAQHGVDLSATRPDGSIAAAQRGLLHNVWSYNAYADGIYFGGNPAHRTTDVVCINGGIINPARSGLVAAHAVDCSVSRYKLDEITRTMLNFEPPSDDCHVERFSLTDSDLGSHGLSILSSGGRALAHIGAVDFSRNIIREGKMVMLLTIGSPGNYRGPYTIVGNEQLSTATHGGTWPTAALICIQASKGATVVDNKGLKLQAGRNMAVVRHRNNSGPVVVHGNDHEGGIEVGPWV